MSEENKKENELSLEQLRQKKEIDEAAWRMLNIFRQFHVINGGIAAVNKYFITANDDVIESIRNMPGGKKLAEHITNLKSNKTRINTINEYLLPFGEDVLLDFQDANKDIYDKEIETSKQPQKTDEDIKEAFADYKKTELKDIPELLEPHEKTENEEPEKKNNTTKEVNIPQFQPIHKEKNISDVSDLIELIIKFNPSPEKLEEFKESKIISDIGQDWQLTIAETLQNLEDKDKDSVINKFQELVTYDKAVTTWNEAQTIIDNPDTINKDNLKSRIDSFKEYLSMFGKSGEEMFNKLNDILNK